MSVRRCYRYADLDPHSDPEEEQPRLASPRLALHLVPSIATFRARFDFRSRSFPKEMVGRRWSKRCCAKKAKIEIRGGSVTVPTFRLFPSCSVSTFRGNETNRSFGRGNFIDEFDFATRKRRTFSSRFYSGRFDRTRGFERAPDSRRCVDFSAVIVDSEQQCRLRSYGPTVSERLGV